MVVSFPRGLRIKEAMHAERTDLGRHPRGGHKDSLVHIICFRASEMEKDTNYVNKIGNVSWQWGQRN